MFDKFYKGFALVYLYIFFINHFALNKTLNYWFNFQSVYTFDYTLEIK